MRRTFPDAGSQLSHGISGDYLAHRVGSSVVFYTTSALTTLADVRVRNADGTAGSAYAGSAVPVNSLSWLPLFLGPDDDSDTLWYDRGSGVAEAVYARSDDRLDALEAADTLGTSAYGRIPDVEGDGTTVDGTAIQAELTSIETASPTNAYTNEKASTNALVLPATDDFYRTTAPITLGVDQQVLKGSGGGTQVKNVTNGSDVVQVLRAGPETPRAVRVEDLNLVGTGTGSRAIYSDMTTGLVVRDVNTYGHSGPSLYLDSTGVALDGSVFAEVTNLIASPSAAVSAVKDVGGIGNVFRNPSLREAEVGLDLVDAEVVVDGGRIESNNQGAAKTGVRARTVDTTADPRLVARRRLVLRGGIYFEGNPLFAVDADYGYSVGIDNVFVAGGSIDNVTASDAVRADGGGTIRRLFSSGGCKVSSAKGKVHVSESSGVYGRASQMVLEGATLPIRHATNSATKSWNKTAPTYTVAGTSAPTAVHDTTTGFHGANSMKVTFPSGGAGYAFSRARLDNAAVAVVPGQMVRVLMAIKASVAGKNLSVRMEAPSTSMTPLEIITDTEWQVLAFEAASDGTGTARPVLHMTADPGVAVDIFVGGVAIAVDAEVSMHDTEDTTLDATRSSALTLGPAHFPKGLTDDTLMLTKGAAVGFFGNGASDTALVANQAYFVRFVVWNRLLVNRFFVFIATSSGNLDVGIWNDTGTGVDVGSKVVSTGSVASPGTGRQGLVLAETLLEPGVYYGGIAADNATIALVWPDARTGRLVPIRAQAGAFPIPTNPTASLTTDNGPLFSIERR